jgi:hypothetical protein
MGLLYWFVFRYVLSLAKKTIEKLFWKTSEQMNRGWGVYPQLRAYLIVYVFENISRSQLQRYSDLYLGIFKYGQKKIPADPF